MSKRIKITLLSCLLAVSCQAAWAQETSSAPATRVEARQQADEEIEKARELVKQGYIDSAVVKYQEAFKIAPNYTVPYEELGKLMMNQSIFAYAIQMYSKLAELEPRNVEYHKVLFSLYDSYGDNPPAALRSGEVLVKQGQADDDTIKRMSELYGQVDDHANKAKFMEMYAERTDAGADYWGEIATTYSAANKLRDAERAVKTAIEKDPSNPKFQNQLGRVYADQSNLSKAEEVFQELAEKHPEDQGVKDELAQLYAQQGDAYLIKGRGNTALKYYDKAESTGSTASGDGETHVGIYRGTVNTTDQIFSSNTSAPGLGIGSYRRGASAFTNLGGTIAERREAAEMLLKPQYLFEGDFGNQDVNSYTLIDNVVRIPVRGTELDLRVRHSWRDVSSFAGSASREYLFAGANYNWNRDWSTQAYVGSDGLYDVTTLYEGDAVRLGVNFQRDVWAFTPRALGTDTYFNKQGGFAGISLGDRFSIDGQVDFYQFNDGTDQTVFAVGPAVQLIMDPGVQELQLSYVYSGVSNNRELDPIVRFSPSSLSAHTVGLEYNRVINDRWRFRGGLYQTWADGGAYTGGDSSLFSWNVGSDFQLWKGAWLGLLYERGNFGRGFITPNSQSIQSKNDNLNVTFGVSF